jgi:hypothetical protein
MLIAIRKSSPTTLQCPWKQGSRDSSFGGPHPQTKRDRCGSKEQLRETCKLFPPPALPKRATSAHLVLEVEAHVLLLALHHQLGQLPQIDDFRPVELVHLHMLKCKASDSSTWLDKQNTPPHTVTMVLMQVMPHCNGAANQQWAQLQMTCALLSNTCRLYRSS